VNQGAVQQGPPKQGAARRSKAKLRVAGRRTLAETAGDKGTTTAEYAMVTMAAVAFGGALLKIVGGDEVAGILVGLVRRALSV